MRGPRGAPDDWQWITKDLDHSGNRPVLERLPNRELEALGLVAQVTPSTSLLAFSGTARLKRNSPRGASHSTETPTDSLRLLKEKP